MKECTEVHTNIGDYSGEIGQHARTNSNQNDKETTELLPSEWVLRTTMVCKNQKTKNEKASLRVKNKLISLVVKNKIDFKLVDKSNTII